MAEYDIVDDELSGCIDYVVALQQRSRARGYNHANVRQRSPLQRAIDDINGHCGEIAFCRYLGVDWTPEMDAFHNKADILDLYEIRTTHHDSGSLIIRDDDRADRCFVLVTGNIQEPPRTMKIRGWIWGNEGKKSEYIRNPHGHRPSWFVPQSALQPMATLPREKEKTLCQNHSMTLP